MSYQRKHLGLAKGYSGLGETVVASVLNLSRPGSYTFYPGEAWSVTVSGKASSPVNRASTRPNVPAQQQMGNTDGSGMFVTSGVMDASKTGTWTEIWSVAGVAAPPVSFTVVDVPATTTTDTTTATSSITDLITQPVFGFPLWAVAGAAFLAFKMLGRR